MVDHVEKLDAAERWFLDGLSIMEPPGFFMLEQVEMQASKDIIARLRQQGIKGTYTHVITRAVAVALSRHLELNRVMLRNRRVFLESVDIGLSVGSELSAAVTPTLVLQGAEAKLLPQLAEEIITRSPEIRSGEEVRLARMRKAARLFPFAWMRRTILRKATSHLRVLRAKTGTFHITTVSHLYQGMPLKFATPAVLSIARVEERAVVVDGQVAVRLVVMLGFSGDHRLWNGNSASLLLHEIKKILESGELSEELTSSQEKVAV